MWGGYLKGISSVRGRERKLPQLILCSRQQRKSSCCDEGLLLSDSGLRGVYGFGFKVQRFRMCRAWLRILDLKFSAVKENQMEKNMEHGMETEIIQGLCEGIVDLAA